MERSLALSKLADTIASIHLPHPVRVGIDGVDASGKTVLAEELVEPLTQRGRSVICVSVDGFHNPREIRYRQGSKSPKGYYEDSFNHETIITKVLEPLGPGGNLIYQSASFDFLSDSEVDGATKKAPPDAVLVFEGVFLHRPELISHWDFSVFVHSDFDVTLKRAEKRDLYLFETPNKVRDAYVNRYIPGQKIYLEEANPLVKSNIVWNNNELKSPILTVNR